jgi:hypothetical protein
MLDDSHYFIKTITHQCGCICCVFCAGLRHTREAPSCSVQVKPAHLCTGVLTESC